MLMVVLKNEQFQRVRLDHWISFHDFVSPFSTIFSSSSARLEQIIKIRSPTNLKRHVGSQNYPLLAFGQFDLLFVLAATRGFISRRVSVGVSALP